MTAVTIMILKSFIFMCALSDSNNFRWVPTDTSVPQNCGVVLDWYSKDNECKLA